MTEYISAMSQMKTSGMDITLLMLCEMLDVSCIVLMSDFMWKSSDVEMDEQKVVYMLMFKGGRCISAKRKDGLKITVTLPPWIHDNVLRSVA